MAADNFEDRVAALEEHVVTRSKTPEDCLEEAERALMRGSDAMASFWLRMAKFKAGLDEIEEDDDAS